MKKQLKKTFTFSLNPEIKKELESLAEQDMRSISGFLEWLVIKEKERRRNLKD